VSGKALQTTSGERKQVFLPYFQKKVEEALKMSTFQQPASLYWRPTKIPLPLSSE